jgi:hypothetical protein
LICRNTAPAELAILVRASVPDAREGVMSTAGNAFLWTIGFFVLSFAAIFVIYFADRVRSNILGKP